MCNEQIIASLVIICSGVLIIAACIPLVKGKIRMNHWYGIRIFRKAFESEENWYKINKYGARRLIIWSVVPIVAGIVALFVPIGDIGVPLVAIFFPSYFSS